MEIYTEESKDMIKAGIIGSTGYAGGELARLLLQRDDVEIKWYGSRSYIDQKYASIYQNMFKIVDDKCMDDNMKELADQVDVIFTATPQGLCSTLVNEEILSKVKIIDLSADFRIKDVAVYEKWYKLTHGSPEYIKEAVYGLPEVNRDKIKNARIIANPGCFPTCSFLSIRTLLSLTLNQVLPVQAEALKLTVFSARSMKISRHTAWLPTDTHRRSRSSCPMQQESRWSSALHLIWFQ